MLTVILASANAYVGLFAGLTVATAVRDNYGDFKFDRLEENSGQYQVEITAPGRSKKTVEAELGASVSLGEIRL